MTFIKAIIVSAFIAAAAATILAIIEANGAGVKLGGWAPWLCAAVALFFLAEALP